MVNAKEKTWKMYIYFAYVKAYHEMSALEVEKLRN